MAEFLPLDGLGGKKYGRIARDSAGKLQPIKGRGYSTAHISIAGTFPAMEITATVTSGGRATGAMTFPKMVMAGHTGIALVASLPPLSMTGQATTRETMKLVMAFPAMTMTGQAYMGAVAELIATFPALTMTGTTGWALAGTLPRLTMAGSATTEEVASLVGFLPRMRMTGNTFTYSEVAHLVGTFPALRAADSMQLVGRFPAMRMYAAAQVVIAGGAGAAAAVTDGWVLNVRNGAVTRLTCWPFTQFARAAGKTFAVGVDGLYVIGGDTLGETEPIQWVFETGASDLGSPAIKHVPYIYMDAIIEGEIEITLIDDRAREYRYKYTGDLGPVHAPHRRKMGNAIRTRNVALRFASPKGAYIEIDAIEPEVNLTQRSLG